jgi:hypothetical protein
MGATEHELMFCPATLIWVAGVCFLIAIPITTGTNLVSEVTVRF